MSAEQSGGTTAMSAEQITAAWVYVQSAPGFYTVGFYRPDGRWEAESDHLSRREASARVHWLNGGERE